MGNKYYRNTDPSIWKGTNTYCNCGSFALDVTSWFSPYDNEGSTYCYEDRVDLIVDMWEEGYEKEDIYAILLEKDQEEILRVCPWIEPVLLSEAEPEERLIAYRLVLDLEESELFSSYVEEDFHFRVRIDGKWYEKCGEGPVVLCENQDVTQEWHCCGGMDYDSDIIYFRFVK